MKELIEKFEEYTKLLSDEINELAMISTIHGWRSKRVEQGRKLRSEIDELKIQAITSVKSEKTPMQFLKDKYGADENDKNGNINGNFWFGIAKDIEEYCNKYINPSPSVKSESVEEWETSLKIEAAIYEANEDNMYVEQAFIAGAKWMHDFANAEKKQQWISVKDRLPEYGTQILVYGIGNSMYGFKKMHVCEMDDLEDGMEFMESGIFYWLTENGAKIDNVTHWMPLPELPTNI